MDPAQYLKTVETVVIHNDWQFVPSDYGSLSFLVPGAVLYQFDFNWIEDESVLHMACGMEVQVPEHRQHEIKTLISKINVHMLAGHFEWLEDHVVIIFRYGFILPSGDELVRGQVAAMINYAYGRCEYLLPMFKFVADGSDAETAFRAVTFNTQGGKQ